MSIGLGCRRRDGETWRECALRYASRWGLDQEVLDVFDAEVERGTGEAEACWTALYEWDVLDLVEKKDEP